ncbi:DUF2207 domain-containing protein [Streptomyces griseus]|uniref:DUF2207 domain-containing protein n=1 Tax=Streptomyces griseus TaxID=1911 RepID=UPI000D14373F|nr:DUF2207 domain-containing protein [Streptomyces griseus]
MWVGAEIAEDGSARVTEVIDYDFGHPADSRHGIYRDLPDLPYDEEAAKVVATMDGGRVPWELRVGDRYEEPDGQRRIATRIQVGDPDRTVTGVHRYRNPVHPHGRRQGRQARLGRGRHRVARRPLRRAAPRRRPLRPHRHPLRAGHRRFRGPLHL